MVEPDCSDVERADPWCALDDDEAIPDAWCGLSDDSEVPDAWGNLSADESGPEEALGAPEPNPEEQIAAMPEARVEVVPRVLELGLQLVVARRVRGVPQAAPYLQAVQQCVQDQRTWSRMADQAELDALSGPRPALPPDAEGGIELAVLPPEHVLMPFRPGLSHLQPIVPRFIRYRPTALALEQAAYIIDCVKAGKLRG